MLPDELQTMLERHGYQPGKTIGTGAVKVQRWTRTRPDTPTGRPSPGVPEVTEEALVLEENGEARLYLASKVPEAQVLGRRHVAAL